MRILSLNHIIFSASNSQIDSSFIFYSQHLLQLDLYPSTDPEQAEMTFMFIISFRYILGYILAWLNKKHAKWETCCFLFTTFTQNFMHLVFAYSINTLSTLHDIVAWYTYKICMFTYKCLCTHLYIYICMCIYAYTHTYANFM